ncbi:protein FAR1-RELATED SEQUENCE 11-like [Silene latifolia]|uniref:protein FAR1-RELATED SEQUENCE 11-like n=1 Tax=Silene latifolia TaxID=37657 RepID=UPI003D778FBD
MRREEEAVAAGAAVSGGSESGCAGWRRCVMVGCGCCGDGGSNGGIRRRRGAGGVRMEGGGSGDRMEGGGSGGRMGVFGFFFLILMENNQITLNVSHCYHERPNSVNFIDLNKEPNEDMFGFENNFVHDLTKDYEREVVLPDNNEDESIFEPFAGQCFLSEEEALKFYEKFARSRGFSVRKGRFINKKGKMMRRDFFCHRQGFANEKFVEPTKEQRNRSSARCGCMAVMRITLKKSNDIFLEEWHVTQFISQHNHELLSPLQVRFLSAYRTISKEDEKELLLYKEAGLSVKQIMRVMELQKNVKHGDLPFLRKDVHNFFSRIRQDNADNDAMDLLEYCKRVKAENPSFQFDYTIDDKKRLENIFWSPAHCFDLYQEYGDSLGFDTTYRVNSYDMPFGIFIRIDNHGRTILFGCALLRNERTDTFRWLMKTFLTIMKKSPKTIITDQDPWMTEAMKLEMKYTKHAFCIWHITSKFSGWFTALLRAQYSHWCAEFYRIYKLDNIDDFEREWSLTVSKFNLQENKHVLGLYEIKESWVPAYLRGYFFGGMTTTGRCESINGFVKRFTSPRSRLTELIKQVDLAVEDIGQTQLRYTMLDTYRGSSLRTLSPLEEQVYKSFTAFSFKKFQEEFERATQYTVSKDHNSVFWVQHYKESRTQKHGVIWNGDNINCSCKLFEFWGILCRHILSVCIHKDCFEIPKEYLPLRWCRDEFHVGRVGVSIVNPMEVNCEDIGDPTIDLGRDDFIATPPISKTKGHPKFRREIGGKEAAQKKTRSCTWCKKSGHNISTCPDKENVDANIGSTIVAKKRKKSVEARDGLNPVFCLKQ